MAGKHKSVENGIVVLVDRLPEPFPMTRYLDCLIWLLWVVDIPSFHKLRNTIQIGEGRGRLRRCTVKHLVDGRFGQTRARPPGILQNESLDAALARFLAVNFTHSNPYESTAADEAGGLPKWRSSRDIGRPANFDPKRRGCEGVRRSGRVPSRMRRGLVPIDE